MEARYSMTTLRLNMCRRARDDQVAAEEYSDDEHGNYTYEKYTEEKYTDEHLSEKSLHEETEDNGMFDLDARLTTQLDLADSQDIKPGDIQYGDDEEMPSQTLIHSLDYHDEATELASAGHHTESFSSNNNLGRRAFSAFAAVPAVAGNGNTGMSFSYGGAVTGMPLREQEKVIDNLTKKNFELKLKVYYLEERLSRQIPDDMEAVMKENLELSINVANLKNEGEKLKRLLLQSQDVIKQLQSKVTLLQAQGENPDNTQMAASAGHSSSIAEIRRASMSSHQSFHSQDSAVGIVRRDAPAADVSEKHATELAILAREMAALRDEKTKLEVQLKLRNQELDEARGLVLEFSQMMSKVEKKVFIWFSVIWLWTAYIVSFRNHMNRPRCPKRLQI